MDILILNWKDIRHPGRGGAEVIVYELAKRLVRDGHQVTWFCRLFPGALSQEEIDGIMVIRRGGIVGMYLLAPVYYWTRKQKPDLVIDCSNTIYWQTPLWAIKSKKVAYLNQLAKEVFWYEFPPIISHFGWLVEHMQYLTYKRTPFLCYAPSTKQDLISMGITAANIKSFPLGLDHDRYLPGAKSRTPLFICVNRLVRMKRTDLAIRAMKLVVEKYPLAKLIIVGTGYDRGRLERISDSLQLKKSVNFADENVWFFQKDSRDKKLKLMQSAWALILPSIKEGWGITVTECAACGTPAIVTDVSGLRDSVIAGKTGLVVSANPGLSELASAMLELVANSHLRTRLSQNAINFASSFTWEKSYYEFSKQLGL